MELLDQFNFISIDVLNQKNLLSNRQDRKFVISAEALPEILNACLAEYDVLEIAGTRNFKYTTTYYDTLDFHMYHEHQRGKQNRCKIRTRFYVDSQIGFVEVKIKNNKDRTIKHRVMGMELVAGKSVIESNTQYSIDELEQVFELQYKRITLLHKKKLEKVTIDSELTYAKGSHRFDIEHLIFAEVKTNDAHDITFCQIMKLMGIRNGSLSKYCLGVISFYPNIKQNSFKLSLKKIFKNPADATNEHTGI